VTSWHTGLELRVGFNVQEELADCASVHQAYLICPAKQKAG
jgi:hypothetical protein